MAGFKKTKLFDEIFPDNLKKHIPSSYHRLGKILLIKLDKKALLHKRQIGSALLKIFPSVDSVFAQEKISGELRKPNVTWIAGKKSSVAILRENNCTFKIDISKTMFSKGNQQEKRRILSKVKKGETILDMFAGIGYFTIPIAKLTLCRNVFAVDLNPDSVSMLKENAELNKVQDKIKIFQGNSKTLPLSFSEKFDRIHLGYLPDCSEFLDAAFFCSKKGTVIHYHGISSDIGKNLISKIKEKAKEKNIRIKILESKKIKSYAPRKEHYVIDFSVLEKY